MPRANRHFAHQFAATHDMKVKAEVDCSSSELVKLDKPWRLAEK